MPPQLDRESRTVSLFLSYPDGRAISINSITAACEHPRFFNGDWTTQAHGHATVALVSLMTSAYQHQKNNSGVVSNGSRASNLYLLTVNATHRVKLCAFPPKCTHLPPPLRAPQGKQRGNSIIRSREGPIVPLTCVTCPGQDGRLACGCMQCSIHARTHWQLLLWMGKHPLKMRLLLYRLPEHP